MPLQFNNSEGQVFLGCLGGINYCLYLYCGVTRSIIIRDSQSQFMIYFCMKHINHSLLSCLITVSSRVNNNSFYAENANYHIIVHKNYPYHKILIETKDTLPFLPKNYN